MADGVAFTVKAEETKERFLLLSSIFERLGEQDDAYDWYVTDEKQKRFLANMESAGRAEVILLALKTRAILHAAGHDNIPFSICGVEDLDYGCRSLFLINSEGAAPTFQETQFDLHDMLSDDEDDASETLWADIDECFFPDSMAMIRQTLLEKHAKIEPLERAKPLEVLITPPQVQLQELKDNIDTYLNIIDPS